MPEVVFLKKAEVISALRELEGVSQAPNRLFVVWQDDGPQVFADPETAEYVANGERVHLCYVVPRRVIRSSCIHCGKNLVKINKNKQYCSESCKQKAYRDRVKREGSNGAEEG